MKSGLSEAPPHYHGHRQRLRDRFRTAGNDALSDYELLELVLFRAIPQRDVKPLAKEMIEKFGSFGEVVAAPPNLLAEVKGLGEAAITELKVVAAAAQRLAKGVVKRRKVLSSWSSVIDYCRTAMAFADKEQFRVLFLDKRNQLIADEVQQTGTVDHTPVYPREVVKRALELHATALILVHNHPSGDPSPSRADIEMTREIGHAATALGIVLRDASIKAEGDLDFRGTLGISKEVPVGFQNIRLQFTLDTDASDEQLDTLLRLTERYCVVFQTLRTPPTLDATVA